MIRAGLPTCSSSGYHDIGFAGPRIVIVSDPGGEWPSLDLMRESVLHFLEEASGGWA